MIIGHNEIRDIHSPVIGKKAYNLYILSKNNFNVPPFYVITGDTFSDYFSQHSTRIEQIINEKEHIKERIIEHMRKHIVFDSEISSVLSSIDYPVSVRSSSYSEDSESDSYAGQFDTFLNVHKDIEEYIIKVAASAFTERNITYSTLRNRKIEMNRIAVIVQKMVNARCSGVIFTADPVSGNDHIVISAAYGLGEGVVSDAVVSDTYIMKRSKEILSKSINDKSSMITISDDGIMEYSVDKNQRQREIFSEDELRELCDNAMNIEQLFNAEQDIEFAYEEDMLYILQARPITAIDNKELTWDNSNIVESFSGPTTPLTFSFANKAYTTIYKLVMRELGVSNDVIMKNDVLFSNMIGFINKRVYYSLESWFRTLSFLPAYNHNSKFMETMMGVDNTYNIKEQFSFSGLWAIVRVIIRIIVKYIRHEHNREHFMNIYEDAMYDFEDKMASASGLKDYHDIYRELETSLLYNWITPIINDIFTMIFYGLLQKYILSISDDDGRLQNDLLTGEGDIESTKVAYSIWGIADMIRNNDYALSLIDDEHLFISKLYSDVSLACIREAFDSFLMKYGNRSVNELKLERENIRDNPITIIPLIRQYVKNERFSTESMQKKEKQIRKRAEQKVYGIINRFSPFRAFIHRTYFNFILKNARRFVKNRENMRFARTNVFGAAKRIFRALGTLFRKRGILNESDDIFFLTVDEIFAYIFGISVTQDLKPIVEHRKKEHEIYMDMEVPERFRTRYVPYTDIPVIIGQADESIKGLGCSPGIISGRVQKVINPYSTDVTGDIMVAEKTDPGWLPIFPLFKAIIIERGSMLSHSAIVARELGIPAVVGVRNAMKILNDMDTVSMNGNTGEIRIIERKDKQ